jgi:class 3 adenylate cyclase
MAMFSVIPAEKALAEGSGILNGAEPFTVIFCDMVRFTQLSKSIGPEEAYSTMDQVYEFIIHIVHDNESTVNEFTGDAMCHQYTVKIYG